MKSTITQLERRFDIPSSLIGVLDGSFEIGNLLVIVFVSYFGAKFHRPRIIAIGSTVMTIGTFLIASPHYFMGRYNYETALTFSNNLTTSTSQCSNMSNSTLTHGDEETSSGSQRPGCEKGGGSSQWIYIFLGNTLRGIGETPTGPLGISYLDDYATNENASFYLGILYTVALIGPLFGYLLGSFCAKLFVDIGFVDLDKVTITSKDARWVGAWWLGFLIAGVFSLLFSIPFWFFPKSLTNETRKKEVDKHPEKMEFIVQEQRDFFKVNPESKISTVDRGFFSSLKALFSNSIYVLYLVSMVIHMNALIGMLTFKPKFIEQHYGQSASKANFIIGLINIPAVCIGFFLGGYMMKRFKLNIIQAAKVGFGSLAVAWLLSFSYFAMGCENSRMAGLTVTYEGAAQVSYEGSALYHNCNAGCFCSRTQWEPVCSRTGIGYVSPCLAGCIASTGTGRDTIFHNCSCISAFTAGNSSVFLGQCPRKDDCGRNFIYFMVVTVLSSLTIGIGAIPNLMILLRSNEPELKSLAIGVYTLLGRTLAGIPAPIYFGALIDKTCLKWGTNKCGKQGACRIYNSDTFRYIFVGLQTSLRAVGLVVFSIIFIKLMKHYAGGHRGTEMVPNQDKEHGPDNGDLSSKIPTNDSDKESNV